MSYRIRRLLLPALVVVTACVVGYVLAGAFGAVLALPISIGALLGVRLLLRRRAARTVERRVAQFVSVNPTWDEDETPAEEDEGGEISRVHLPFEKAAWYQSLDSDVRLSRLGTPTATIVIYTAIACVLAAALGIVLLNFPFGLLAALIPPLVAWEYVQRELRKLRTEFADQLPETLDVVASALRAGHGLVGALTVAANGAAEPSRSELGRALGDEQLGTPLDQTLRVTAERMDNRDVYQLALVAQLQREAGTNAAEVIDQVAANVRSQIELRRLVRMLTAQGRMSRWIVSLLPVFLFVAIYFINRDYLSPLWETTGGKVAMAIAVMMILAGSYVIKKIVEIEV